MLQFWIVALSIPLYLHIDLYKLFFLYFIHSFIHIFISHCLRDHSLFNVTFVCSNGQVGPRNHMKCNQTMQWRQTLEITRVQREGNKSLLRAMKDEQKKIVHTHWTISVNIFLRIRFWLLLHSPNLYTNTNLIQLVGRGDVYIQRHWGRTYLMTNEFVSICLNHPHYKIGHFLCIFFYLELVVFCLTSMCLKNIHCIFQVLDIMS